MSLKEKNIFISLNIQITKNPVHMINFDRKINVLHNKTTPQRKTMH